MQGLKDQSKISDHACTPGAVIADVHMQCRHQSPTDEYRMVTQSHEMFALGLTTASAEANLDGHTQVMKIKIAAINDKFVAQEGPGEKALGDTHKCDAEVSPGPTVIPPKPTSRAAKPSKPRNSSVGVSCTHTAPMTYRQGINKPFRVVKNKTPRVSRCVTSDKNKAGRVEDSAAKPRPEILQKLLESDVMSSKAVKQPLPKHIAPRRSGVLSDGDSHHPEILKSNEPPYEEFRNLDIQKPTSRPGTLNIEPNLGRRSARFSTCSSQGSHTLPIDGNMTCPTLSSSPTSEWVQSNPPSFTHPSEIHLERSASQDCDLPERSTTTCDQIPSEFLDKRQTLDIENFEPLLYSEFLNDDDFILVAES